MRQPTSIHRDSTQTLSQMERARGATWLDRRLHEVGVTKSVDSDIHTALKTRQTVLEKMGYSLSQNGRLSQNALDDLREMDLSEAAGELSETINKPYSALGSNRTVEGIFREAIDRPSGQFAVIERAKDFTLVPWRPVMQRGLGKSITGRVSAAGISWDVSKQRGLSR